MKERKKIIMKRYDIWACELTSTARGNIEEFWGFKLDDYDIVTSIWRDDEEEDESENNDIEEDDEFDF